MKKILKKGDLLNIYDHDVMLYKAIGNTRREAACSRGALKRYGWMVLRSSSLVVRAFKRVK